MTIKKVFIIIKNMKNKIYLIIFISTLTAIAFSMNACDDLSTVELPPVSHGGTISIINNYLITQNFEIVFSPGEDETLEWSSPIPGGESIDVDVPRDGIYGVFIIVGGTRFGRSQKVDKGLTQTFTFNP